MKTGNRTLLLTLLAITTFPAWASISSDLPRAQSAGSVKYLSGGSDPAQAKAMRSEAPGYPLELDFLWGRGQKETQLTGVQWSIGDAAGHQLVNASSGGPEVLASLPDGRYTVTARYEETTLSRVVSVHKGIHDTVVLEWPS
jgi:hypothetical protein